MANNNQNEINRTLTREGKTQRLRSREAGKLIKRAEAWRTSTAGQNLDKAEGIGRAVGRRTGQLRETLGWPMGY